MQSIARLDRSEKIGVVTAVDGGRLTGMGASNSVDGMPAIEFGSLVTMRLSRTVVFGLVSRIWREPGNAAATLFEVEITGEVSVASGGPPSGFQRGVSRYPRIGAEIFEATSEDVARVYAVPVGANVRVGSLHQDPDQPVHVLLDELLGKHFAVLGTTGSGKSCATALILRAALSAHRNGHVVILDPHDEYSAAFPDLGQTLDTTTLRLPYWLLSLEESVALLCSQDGDTREYEAAILKDAILKARREYAVLRGGARANVDYITVDTPAPYHLLDLQSAIEKGLGRLEKPGGAVPYLRLQARIEALQADDRLAFLIPPEAADDTLADIMGEILRIPAAGRPITILDLSGVPSEVVDILVSVLCRLVFDFALWSAERETVPILFVCEEAHRYVPRDERAGFGPTRRAITRIAMEGRKYGVSLGLVSNRPSELAPTMLAQCNTIFAMRMSNHQDHAFVRSALPEGAAGLVGALPALRTQEAIAVGEGVGIPLRLRFDDLAAGQRPRSGTVAFSRAWQEQDVGRDHVRETISRWRQHRKAIAKEAVADAVRSALRR